MKADEFIDKPRIRKYKYTRPDGSTAIRYEVLDSKGRRVPGQGIEGYDNYQNAKAHLDRISEGQIYFQGGGGPQSQHYYEPRHVPNQNELEKIDEDLRKWFKEKWVRFNPQGKIMGPCARGSDKEGKPKCLPQAKAHALGKKGRKYAASKKRREDPNPERRGPAKNVATKKKTNEDQLDELKCWPGYTRVKGVKAGAPGSCKKKSNEGVAEGQLELSTPDPIVVIQDKNGKMLDKLKLSIAAKKYGLGQPQNIKNQLAHQDYTKIGNYIVAAPIAGQPQNRTTQGVIEDQAPMFTPESKCPHCGGKLVSEELMNEKKDACYYKVKSRYKVWPSAYASGALVKCRKKGAKNWGNKSEGIEENKGLPFPGTYEQETLPFRTKGQKRTQAIAFEETQLDEKWSEKYKRSINCNNPKGFSQRAHCQGRKKK